MKQNWTYKNFEDCLEKVKYTSKIPTSDYLGKGKYPIVSQEEGLIAGYWNEEADVFKTNKPVVIFGDHTRILKYVDFDFVLGADGVKILQPIDGLSAKFLLYYLQWCNIPSLGYSRHYKLLKEIKVPTPSKETQSRIVSELDLLQSIIDKQKAQLTELDNLAQAVFYDMFGDPVENEKGWEVKKLGDLLKDIRYGTSLPPVFSEYGYKFIRATNIKKGRIIEEGMKYIDDSEAQKLSKCKLSGGELIIVRSGVNAGDTCEITREYVGQYAGYDIIVKLGDELNSTFANSLINTRFMDAIVKPLTKRSAQPHLNSEQVQSFPIILPLLSLQQSFAAKIEAIESQKVAIRQSIEESEKLFNFTMDKYFE